MHILSFYQRMLIVYFNNQFDYDGLKKKALEQFRSGKSLFGKDGTFAPLLNEFLESAMEAELEEQLTDD